MIVICTKCQAKFRVADGKIGPRGARVRCSRCKAIFHVDAPPAPPPEPASAAAQAPARMAVELENPFAAAAPGVPPDDPFAAAGLGAPLQPAPAVSPSDPFAAPAAAADDPFAPRPSDDPFAAAAAAAAPAPAAPRDQLAVTDLADLLGAAAAAPPEPALASHPAPEADAQPEPAFAAAPPEREPEPEGVALPPIAAEAPDLAGLALEDRVTPPPLRAGLRPVAGSPVEPAGAFAAAPGGDGFTLGDPQAFGAIDFGAEETGAPLALAGEATLPPPLPAPSAAEPAPAPAAAAAVPVVPVAEAPELLAPAPAPAAPPPGADRLAPQRRSRVRSAILNAVALVAMLLVTVALLVLWRSEGPLDTLSFRPSAIVAALRGAGPGPFSAVDVRSGVYERERGGALLFVRGKVLSRATAPVKAVKIVVEVVRAEGVVARGEGLAGAVPSAEELWSAPDGAAFASVTRAVAARAPAEIRPGDVVPFLVAIADPPADLEGASVRVVLAAAAGAAP
jgi:predicted Zn finger-like uncharacterized protein